MTTHLFIRDQIDTMNLDDKFELISRCLQNRVNYTRKTCENLRVFTDIALYCTGSLKSPGIEEAIIATTSEFLERILKDCEVTFEMTYVQALDALAELSNLATLYANTTDHFRICEQIKTIRASYPVQIE